MEQRLGDWTTTRFKLEDAKDDESQVGVYLRIIFTFTMIMNQTI
jgi:hypothetical protein